MPDRTALSRAGEPRCLAGYRESRGSLWRRLDVVLVAGVAHVAWEHEQGRHGRPHLLCPICWLNKIAPAPEAPGGASPAEPPEQA
jgi:hypothetical protein